MTASFSVPRGNCCALLPLINIHDLFTPFYWSILPIETHFAARYFRLFPYDLIP